MAAQVPSSDVDHASFNRAGVPAAFAAEDTMQRLNPKTHTDQDTFQFLSFDRVEAFIRNTLGFTVEVLLYNPGGFVVTSTSAVSTTPSSTTALTTAGYLTTSTSIFTTATLTPTPSPQVPK
jgi:Zn-dependent M28 family amino/carboxypeptidase